MDSAATGSTIELFEGVEEVNETEENVKFALPMLAW